MGIFSKPAHEPRRTSPMTYTDLVRSEERKLVQQNAELNQSFQARTKELEAELAAIEAPAEAYRIEKDFASGKFAALRWVKEVRVSQVIAWRDGRHTWSGYKLLAEGLPSIRAAEAFLRAYIDPATNRRSYTADGKLLDPGKNP